MTSFNSSLTGKCRITLEEMALKGPIVPKIEDSACNKANGAATSISQRLLQSCALTHRAKILFPFVSRK